MLTALVAVFLRPYKARTDSYDAYIDGKILEATDGDDHGYRCRRVVYPAGK